MPRTASLPGNARLPTFVDVEPPLHLGFLVMVALAALGWVYLGLMVGTALQAAHGSAAPPPIDATH